MRPIKAFWNWVSHGSTAWGLLPAPWQAAVSAGLSAVAGGFGVWTEGIAWGIFIATGVFAFAATGLLRFDEHQERTNPSGRFQVETPFYAPVVTAALQPAALETIQFGLVCKNTANFALHYQVEDFYAEIMGRVTTEARRNTPATEVYAKTTAIYRDLIIKVHSPVAKPFATGRIKFKIAYWKIDSKKYHIERSMRFELRPESEEAGAYIFTWAYE